ncbi:MAG: hypothetical protein VW647_10110 [Alphaproteobacteria bacterium]
MYEVGKGVIHEYVNLGGNNYLAVGEVVNIASSTCIPAAFYEGQLGSYTP